MKLYIMKNIYLSFLIDCMGSAVTDEKIINNLMNPLRGFVMLGGLPGYSNITFYEVILKK